MRTIKFRVSAQTVENGFMETSFSLTARHTFMSARTNSAAPVLTKSIPPPSGLLLEEPTVWNRSFFLRFAPKQRSPLAIGFLTDIKMEVIGNIHDTPELLNPKQS